MRPDQISRFAAILARTASELAALAEELAAQAAPESPPEPAPASPVPEPPVEAPRPAEPQPEPPATADADEQSERRAAARRVFEYWVRRCGHDRARFTPERARKVLARLRDGYSERDIKRAIDGCASSPWHNGSSEKSDGQRYDDLELICRTGSKLERFIAMAGESLPDESIAKRDEASDQRAELIARAKTALKEGRTDDYNRLVRSARSG